MLYNVVLASTVQQNGLWLGTLLQTITSYLVLLMQVQKPRKSFRNSHSQIASPLAFKGMMSGSISLNRVESGWILSDSLGGSRRARALYKNLVQQNQGLGHRGLDIL